MSDLAKRIAQLSPEQRALVLQRLQAQRGLSRQTVIPRHPRGDDTFPLSFAQERLWFLNQLLPDSSFYNLSNAQQLPFQIDPEILQHALTELVHRHESLRTTFSEQGEGPYQSIGTARSVSVPVIDLRVLKATERESEAQRLASQEAQTPFDLATGPLFRIKILRLTASSDILLTTLHHIIADGWSLEVFARELGALYTAYASGQTVTLPELPIQYVDYAVWQRQQFDDSSALAKQISYWTQHLAGIATLDLPTDRPRPPQLSFQGWHHDVSVSEPLLQRLRAIGQAENATLFMTLFAGFAALLQRYSDQDDIIVGTPIANRDRTELENIVGFFVNSVVIRCDLSGRPTFRQLLQRVRDTVLDGYLHSDLPFSKLVEAIRPAQDFSRNPLFQVSFQLYTPTNTPSNKDPSPQSLSFDRGSSIFDLVLNLWEVSNHVEGRFEFNTALFEPSTITTMFNRYRLLLSAVVTNPDQILTEIPLLTSEERAAALAWNHTAASDPPACLHQLFEQQVHRTPDACAVTWGTVPNTRAAHSLDHCPPNRITGNDRLSYRQLNADANRLARLLCRQGCGPGTRVGILMERNTSLMVALMGVLKTGAAYVPLDPTTPNLRLTTIIAEAELTLVLTQSTLMEQIVDAPAKVLSMDAAATQMDAEPSIDLAAKVTLDDVAYVIFTSGSTGKPKGVMVSHRSVVNYLTWCLETYPVNQGEGAPVCSPISSDMSITSLFVPLLAGKTVMMLPEDELIDALDTHLRSGPRCSFVKITPSHLKALSHLANGRGVPTGTAAFIVGGEQLLGEVLDPWRQQAPHIMVFNEYGPTETTVGCCMFAAPAGEIGPGPVPIGQPIANMHLYVLDSCGALTLPGVPGELYIGGVGVSQGYFGQPQLTANRFITAPVSIAGHDHFPEGNSTQERLFKSGDLVRLRRDKQLEFLVRLDNQVKIRGFRVELSEIEAVLSEHTHVTEAVVSCQVDRNGDSQIIAFITPLPTDESLMQSELRSFLSQLLPVYMVPNLIVFLSVIPLTRAGKVDLNALKNWKIESSSRDVTPPNNTLELVLSTMFAEVLDVDQVGLHNDFFTLGGHSLLATRLVSRIRENFQISFALRLFFEGPTVAKVAQAMLDISTDHHRIYKTAEVLERLLAMSDDEVKLMLSQEN